MSDDNGQPQPEQSGPQFNPQSGFPVGGDQPGAPPPYPAAGGGTPYTAPQPPYAGQQQPGYPGFPTYVLPDHPKATTALVVGLVSVVGAFTCLLPILASPVAWVMGAQARREIRAAPQQWGGESRATTGMVLGIIGTVLLALGLLTLIVVIFVIAAFEPTSIEYDTGV
jgi:hypothetical protein